MVLTCYGTWETTLVPINEKRFSRFSLCPYPLTEFDETLHAWDMYEVEFFETGQLNDLWGQPYIAHDKAIDV